jgi:hypothetical protein
MADEGQMDDAHPDDEDERDAEAPESLTAAMERLLARLLPLTIAGRVDWVPAPAGDGYEFVGDQASVSLKSRDGDDRHPFVLELYDNQRGAVADRLVTGYFGTGPEPYDEEPQPWNDDLAELYARARAQALRVDTLTKALIGDISNSAPNDTPA